MSEAAPQAGSPLVTMLSVTVRRLGASVLPFVVVILIWQFASLFFPRFLFPSLIDVFWRCLEIFSNGTMFADVLARSFAFSRGLPARLSSVGLWRC
jgi:ABC-type nitrate/sulfonate/bicarbonate transport system permease component